MKRTVAGKEISIYDKRCLHLSREEVQRRLDAGEPHVIRFNMPTEGTTTFHDVIYGDITVNNEEMEELISGSTTLAELEQKRFNLPSSGTSDAATVSPEDAAAAQAPAASSTSASPAEAPSSYDVELQALINQLYAVKANAESGLNSAIQSAKDEYHALPADKQTATRKVSISELQKLEADCDKQVDAIVEKMRTLLQENGQSTELADQVKASYKAQKSAMYASLKSQLLG